jgi:hypothetical protein
MQVFIINHSTGREEAFFVVILIVVPCEKRREVG